MAACLFATGFHNLGSVVNPQDLAPKHSGSVFGIMNATGAIPGECERVIHLPVLPPCRQRPGQKLLRLRRLSRHRRPLRLLLPQVRDGAEPSGPGAQELWGALRHRQHRGIGVRFDKS